ncbi:Mitochondrial import inner membrane translocase subunit tim8 [Collariella sp. IMI 366227]|nr:Mitochondrial import inner membrane translocase subunit tim8 [Collariella sp. IMI 366227]
MSSTDFQIDHADLERLNDKDKGELRQFFTSEEQRARIQGQSHELTQMCFKKCISPGTVRSAALDKNEQSCLSNCVDRFMDANFAIVKHLSSMRQQQ